MEMFLDKGNGESKTVVYDIIINPNGSITEIQDFCNRQTQKIFEAANMPKQLVRVGCYDGPGYSKEYKPKQK